MLTAKGHIFLSWPQRNASVKQAVFTVSPSLPDFQAHIQPDGQKKKSTKCFLGIHSCSYCQHMKSITELKGWASFHPEFHWLPFQTLCFKPISSAPMTPILALVKFAEFIRELENKERSYKAARVSKGRQSMGKKLYHPRIKRLLNQKWLR